MGAADAAGDAAAGDGLLDAAAVDDVSDLDAPGDFDADKGGLDKAGLLRAGEVCALAKVKGASARIAVAINETVDFMRTLSFFRLRRGSSRTVRRPHRSQCASIRVLLGEAIGPVFLVSIRILDPLCLARKRR
jgi:hypothetical protein